MTMRNKLAIILAVSALALSGCASEKETGKSKEKTNKEDKVEATTEETSEETSEVTTEATAADTTEATTEAVTEVTSEATSETTAETSTEAATESTAAVSSENAPEAVGEETDTASSTASSEDTLYPDAEKYIKSVYAFYDEMAGTHLHLMVFDSQIEVTDDGYIFVVRSQDGKDANVYFSEVKVNTETGEMSDDLGNTWNVKDYS